ncbi:sensor histidine kinase [Caulobacter segnis]
MGRIRDASAAVLLETLNDVLDFAKLEAGGVDLDRRPFALRTLLNKVAGMFEAQALARGSGSGSDHRPGLPANGWRAMAIACAKCWSISWGTRIQFTGSGSVSPSPSSLGMAPRRVLARLELAVSDTGVGVPAAMLGHGRSIASPRQGQQVSRKFGGTGLGIGDQQGDRPADGRRNRPSTASPARRARFWCVLDLLFGCRARTGPGRDGAVPRPGR